MNLRAELEKRIDKKRGELAVLQGEISDLFTEVEKAESVIQELQSLLKLLPKEGVEGEDEPKAEIVLRRGSDASQAREALRKVRKPLHIDDILRAMDRQLTPKTRKSLAGQLAWYVRKEQIFTRTEPNTFGLREWDVKKEEATPEVGDNDLSDALPMPTVASEAGPPPPPPRVRAATAAPPLPPAIRRPPQEIEDDEIPF